jgi:hypothetical protein
MATLQDLENQIRQLSGSILGAVQSRVQQPVQSAMKQLASLVGRTGQKIVDIGKTPMPGWETKDPKQAAMELAMGFGPGVMGTISGKAVPIYKETEPLTTKILKKLEGKTTVSKQFIQDLTNAPELKQQERNIVRNVLESQKSDIIPVADFATKVKHELLPLNRKTVGSEINALGERFTPRYEYISLPDELRGNVANYSEHIYESPIKTSAGQTHFGEVSKNYFGHTRIEDMASKTAPSYRGGGMYDATEIYKTGEKIIPQSNIRRVIEVQSDLYQKGNLEREMPKQVDLGEGEKLWKLDRFGNTQIPKVGGKAEQRMADINKLQQYNDPTAHFRMVREEVKQAAIDGKTKLQFPTGETAMKVEGLTREAQQWMLNADTILKPEHLKVGEEIAQGGVNQWIITDILGNGKFKAVPKEGLVVFPSKITKSFIDKIPSNFKETFDISGKVDTNNPIYKFYEKDLGRYLRSKYNATTITDSQGVTWNEVQIKPEYKGPIEAFGGGIATLPILQQIQARVDKKKKQ